jgi:hypothetical protein
MFGQDVHHGLFALRTFQLNRCMETRHLTQLLQMAVDGLIRLIGRRRSIIAQEDFLDERMNGNLNEMMCLLCFD